jgi:hypothetical protein
MPVAEITSPRLIPLFVWFTLTATALAQQIAPVRVIKIAAGPAGVESSGTFTLTDERSVFSRTSDREVIVWFQWEDRPGAHKLVGQWRSPDGGITTSTAFDYSASDKRFGAMWRLPLTPAMPLGTWSIEATVDGRPAGRHSFDITDVNIEPAAVARRRLTPAELFDRLNPLFFVVRRAAADGRELEPAAAFVAVPASGRIHTVVPVIDGADSLRAVGADGSIVPISQLVAWDRRQQWAVVQGPRVAATPVGVAAPEASAVGTRCFSIEGSPSGTRALTDGTLTGYAGTASERVLIATFSSFGMPGAPVVDEYGDLIGIVGAGLPGDPRPVDDVVVARGPLKGAPVIPFSSIRSPEETAVSELSALRTAGEIVPSPVAGAGVPFGGFTRATVKRGDVSIPDLVTEYSLRDAMIRVFLLWTPTDRIRGNAVVRLSDSLNRLLGASAPQKMDAKKGQAVRSTWEMPMVKQPGMYRVDVTVDGRTYWRGFVRISP